MKLFLLLLHWNAALLMAHTDPTGRAQLTEAAKLNVECNEALSKTAVGKVPSSLGRGGSFFLTAKEKDKVVIYFFTGFQVSSVSVPAADLDKNQKVRVSLTSEHYLDLVKAKDQLKVEREHFVGDATELPNRLPIQKALALEALPEGIQAELKNTMEKKIESAYQGLLAEEKAIADSSKTGKKIDLTLAKRKIRNYYESLRACALTPFVPEKDKDAIGKKLIELNKLFQNEAEPKNPANPGD